MVRATGEYLNGLWDYAIMPRLSNERQTFREKYSFIPIDLACRASCSGWKKPYPVYRQPRAHSQGHGKVSMSVCTSALWTGSSGDGERQGVGQNRGGYDRFSFDITDQLLGARRGNSGGGS